MAKYLSNLPPMARGRYKRTPHPEHVLLADKARAKPGQWLEARSFGSSAAAGHFAQAVRNGKYLAFRTEKWEATQRDRVVYIRYAGAHRDEPESD